MPTSRSSSVLARRSVLVGALAVLAAFASPTGDARADAPTYALDELSREVPTRGKFRCPDIPLTLYGGSLVPFQGQVQVHPAFVAKLKELEALVRAVAIEVYGRAPASLQHLGAYNCRRIPGYPNLVSEHGLGNGIDVAAFNFAPLPKGQKLPEGLPRELAQGFGVSVMAHFDAKGAAGTVHKRFLHRLALRLRPLFRVVLGPGYVGHQDHFHLDMAPYTLFDVSASAEAAK